MNSYSTCYEWRNTDTVRLTAADACKKKLARAAVSQLGSGCAWLILDGDKIKAVKTANAEVPLTSGMKPLFTIDVWGHAYYLDY